MQKNKEYKGPMDRTEPFNVDHLLKGLVKPAGLWQWGVVLYLTLTIPAPPTFPVYANSLSNHRCAMEPRVEHFISRNRLPFDQVLKRISPGSSRYGCNRYALNWDQVNLTSIFFGNVTSSSSSSSSIEPCPNGCVFHPTWDKYPGSVVSEFQLVCQSSWLIPFGTSIYMLGMLIGFVMGGLSGDRLGRRWTLFLFNCVEIFAAIGVSLSPTYWIYVLFRAIVAIGNTVKISVGNVLMLEITTSEYRSIYGAILALGLDFIFRALMAAFAYFIPNWRGLNLVCMCSSIFGLLYLFILPESPRWLISRKMYGKALSELKTGHRINHLFTKSKNGDLKTFEDLSNKAWLLENESEVKKMNKVPSFDFKLMWHHLQTTILGSLVVFGIVLCFFGLMLYTRIMNGSIYLLGILSALTGIPSTFAAALIYRYLRGRKRPLMFVLAMASLFLTLSIMNRFIHTQIEDLILSIFVNLALCILTVTICMIYVYIPELFPSDCRAQQFGLIFAFSRIGTMICPYVNELDFHTVHGTPLLVYAGTILLVVVLLLFLPDTDGQNLKDHSESVPTIT